MTSDRGAVGEAIRYAWGIRWDKWSVSYFCVLVLVIIIAVRYPTGDYDGLFYTALTVKTTNARVLQQAGLEYERHLPQEVPSSYRDDMRNNPEHFTEQLPFYSVKPLYVFALGLVRSVGFNWRAGALISSVSFVVLGLLIWLWLRAYFSSIETLVLAVLLVFNPSLFRLVRWTSPDVMAVLTVMAGAYVITETRRTISGIGLLLVAIWIRPETVVFSGMVICAAYLRHKLSFIPAAVLAIGALGSYGVIVVLGGFPRSTLFYNTFIERTNAPAETVFVVTGIAYGHVLMHSLQLLFFANPMVIFPFLVLGIDYFLLKQQDMYSFLLLAAVLSSIVIYATHPQMDARYYCYQWELIPALALLIHTKRAVVRANFASH